MISKIKIIVSLFFFLTIGALLLYLDFYGIIWHNDPFASFYQVKGIDISNHQGNIDWEKVAKTGKYSFVFMKATEGHDFTDDYFVKNWQEAKQNGLFVGAYHFFSIRSSGKEQAQLFIENVPYDENALPPVIDIEIDITQDPEKIRRELEDLISLLEKHYKKSPILYVTYETYNAYVKGRFPKSNIWIRDVFKFPYLGERNWLFWQYSNRGRVDGIDRFVDINVFRLGKDELEKMTKE